MMKKVMPGNSKTSMVLWIILGIVIVGMLFFGVAFKIGSIESFKNDNAAKGKAKKEDNADDEKDPKPNKRKGLGKLMNIAEDIIENTKGKKMSKESCERFNKIMTRANNEYKERGQDLKDLNKDAKAKGCK
jgi:hypothetical protein